MKFMKFIKSVLVLVLFVLRYAVSDFPFGIFKCTFLGDWEKKLLQKSEYLPEQAIVYTVNKRFSKTNHWD
jgi:hypothetical protein